MRPGFRDSPCKIRTCFGFADGMRTLGSPVRPPLSCSWPSSTPRLNQCLAEIPQSVRIRDRGVQIKTVEAQPGYPITRHRLRRVERQPTEALRRQHLELQNRVQRHSREFGRKSAKSTVAAVCADRSPFGAISVEVPLKFPKAKLFRHPDLRFFQPLRIVPSDKKHRVFEGANRVGQQQTAMLRSAEPRSVNIGIRPRKFWITQCQGVLRGLPHCKVRERVFDLNPDFVGPKLVRPKHANSAEITICATRRASQRIL